jgi:CheY-like chemotaxis protein
MLKVEYIPPAVQWRNEMSLAVCDNIRIVIIDDDHLLRNLLVEAFNRHGYQAVAVENPERAVELVKLFGAQIVLCDICMPGVDGFEVTRRLKASDGGTQVILMTGYPAEQSVNSAFHAGAEEYLVKPFRSLQVVFDSVDRAAARLVKWNTYMREAIRQDFPDEYNIIYDHADDKNFDLSQVDHLLARVGDLGDQPQ